MCSHLRSGRETSAYKKNGCVAGEVEGVVVVGAGGVSVEKRKPPTSRHDSLVVVEAGRVWIKATNEST